MQMGKARCGPPMRPPFALAHKTARYSLCRFADTTSPCRSLLCGSVVIWTRTPLVYHDVVEPKPDVHGPLLVICRPFLLVHCSPDHGMGTDVVRP